MMVLNALTPLLDYVLILSPVLCLFAAWFWITPSSLMGLRVAILLIAFMFTRDLMTPCGLWMVGGKPVLQFHANVWILALLGVASILLITCLARLAPALWRLVTGFKGNRACGLAIGMAAGCAIGIPIRIYQGIESPPLPWMLGFVFFAFAGNALEEVLFRGMLQGLLERVTSAQRAALGSAIAFSACHAYLAFILTQVGWPIMLFTLVEGLVCAQVRLWWGTVPAVVAHGTAIALLGAPMG
jgi:membrane protease YdiL (CAAX protease family)